MNFELLIEKTAFGGEGIGHVDGKTCFVEGALPGEKVEVRLLQDKKNFLRAKIVKILNASPERIQEPCAYIRSCGGCQYQHVTYAGELKIKEAQVKEALRYLTSSDPSVMKPIVASPKEYRYRNSVTLHAFSDPPPKNAAPLAFFGRDNVSKVVIKDCLLVDEGLKPVFGEKFRIKSPKTKISFKLSEKGEIFSDAASQFFRVRVDDRLLMAGSEGFFQNNLEVTAQIAKKVSEKISLMKPGVFFDLYAGVGTFSVLSAASVPKIYAIEESKPSLDALRMNKEENKLASLEIIPGRVEKVFPDFFKKNPSENTVLFLDPPRQGLGGDLPGFLAEAEGIKGLLYLSCDLMTLARDLKTILSKGRYRLEEVIPFDMFPHTKHIEVLAVLVRS